VSHLCAYPDSWLTSNDAPELPTKDFIAGLLKRRNLTLRSWHGLDDKSLAKFMKWFMRQLTKEAHNPPDLIQETQSRSSLANVSLHLPLYSPCDINPDMAGALAKVLLDEKRFPMLEGMMIRFSLAIRDKSNSKDKEIESAMCALKERGILHLLWQ
jgi:hypothetical protein